MSERSEERSEGGNSLDDSMDQNGVEEGGGVSYNTNASHRPGPPCHNPEGLPPTSDAPDKDGKQHYTPKNLPEASQRYGKRST